MAFIREQIRGSTMIGVQHRIIVNRMRIKKAENKRLRAAFAVKGI